MKRFYFSQEEKDITIKFIVSGFIYCIIVDYIYWYSFSSFLSRINYCSEIYSGHKKEDVEKNQALEVKMKEHMNKNKSKLQELDYSFYEEVIYENKLYEKIIQVENIEQPYEKIIEVENTGEHNETVIEKGNIEKSEKEHILINQLGCEVDIPIDKIVAFIHNIT